MARALPDPGQTFSSPRPPLVIPFGVEITCGYALVLLATLAFKYLYLEAMTSGGVVALLAVLEPDRSGLGRVAPAILLFALEPAEVCALLTAGLVIGRGILRLPLAYAIGSLTFLCLVAASANYLAVREVNGFLTVDSLRLGLRWAMASPDTARAFVTPRRITGLGLAVGWAALPGVLARVLTRTRQSRRRPLVLAQATLGVTILASVGTAAIIGTAAGGYPAAPVRGYWSTALLAFARLDEADPTRMHVPVAPEIRRAYLTAAFPEGLEPAPLPLLSVPVELRRPRHVLIVSLETAPQKYYPLVGRSDLPTLVRMSERALTSDRHYAAAPSTGGAIFGIVTGTYPRSAVTLGRFQRREGEGLATRLSPHGYEATYVDAFAIDWEGGNRGRWLLGALGFGRLVQTYADPALGDTQGFDRAVRREERALEVALQSVIDAEHSGRKALVTVATNLGHYRWRAQPGDESLPDPEKLRRIAQRIDGLLGRLLAGLEAGGLGEDVIVVVTGDHGLRFRMEFESLDEAVEHGDLEFNVPLLIYAPGLLSSRVAVPYASSHVDIVPTVLELLGLQSDSGLLHGMSILDRRLESRITFLMSGGMSPVNGFHWRGRLYTNDVTGRVRTRLAAYAAGKSSLAPERPVLTGPEVRRILQEAQTVFDWTAAHFMRQ